MTSVAPMDVRSVQANPFRRTMSCVGGLFRRLSAWAAALNVAYLSAQGQCRATLETLATIKNGPAGFAREANIAHGPQQVNNGVPLARAEHLESLASKLLEAHGEGVTSRPAPRVGYARRAG